VAVQGIHLDGFDARHHLARERDLFDRLRRAPRAACLFFSCDPCIVLGRNNRAHEWVHQDAAEADGIPVLRRFSGGGTVYLDRDVLNYSFIVPRRLLDELARHRHAQEAVTARYIRFFRHLIVSALSRGGAGYSLTGASDISLNGRKVSGNAQRIAATLVLHHGTLLMRCPLAAIERYLPIPPDRPGISHARHITGLAEEGRAHSLTELATWLSESLSDALAPASPNQPPR
jgi:lipoate-protein ligase A